MTYECEPSLSSAASLHGKVVDIKGDILKKIVWITVFVVLATVTYFYWPNSINREYDSVVYSTDSGFERRTTVQLSGTQYRALLGKRYVTGKLKADHDLSYDIRLEWNGRYYFGTIADFDAAGLLHTSGSVMGSDRFEKVWLQLNEINQRYNITGYVSGPAGNLKEGNEVARHILGEGQHLKPMLQEERK